MPVLYMDPDADVELARLENDPTMSRLLAAVNRILDQVEADPGDTSVRRHRFTNGLWAVTAVVGNDERIVLWERHPDEPDGVMVHYLGPPAVR